jgi:hypothetical protein
MRAQTRTMEPWLTVLLVVLVAVCMTPMFGARILEDPLAWPQVGVPVLLAWLTAFGATSGRYPVSRGTPDPSGPGGVCATWPLRIRINNGVIIPAFFPLMAGWAGPWRSERMLVAFLLFTGFALVMAVVLWRGTGDAWRLSESGVERVGRDGERKGVVAWSEVLGLGSEYGRDLRLRTARDELMIPLQLDGVGDLARLAVRHLPEPALASNPKLAELLRDLAADRWLRS